MIDQDKMRALAAKYRMLLDDLDIKSATKAFTGDGRTFADAKRAIEELIAELEAAAADKRDALAFRDLMAKVIREINHGEYNHPYRGIENAPMHGHEVPGIWDSDNGAKAGTPCAWCATWNAARAALAQRQGEGS